MRLIAGVAGKLTAMAISICIKIFGAVIPVR